MGFFDDLQNDGGVATQSKGFFDTLDEPKKKDPIILTDISPKMGGQGTVSVLPPDASRGPLEAAKDFFFKEQPIKLQAAFTKPSEALVTKGTRSMEVAYSILNRTPEFFVGLAPKLLATVFPGHEVATPFDAGRLSGAGGKEGNKKLNTYGQDYLDGWAEADRNAGLPEDQVMNPGNIRSLFHGTVSALENIIGPSLAVADAGSIVKEVTRSFLERSGFQSTLGLKYSRLADLAPDDFINTITKRTKSVVDETIADVQAGRLTPEAGNVKMSQIANEYYDLGNLYKGRVATRGPTYMKLNKIGQAFEDISVALNENIKDLGSRNYAPLEGAIKPAEETLPGYRETPGQAPAFGLSTRKVEPVGFGDDINAGSKVSKDLEPLAEEARKYKSVENFVQAQGHPLYHGTNATFGSFDISKAGTGEGSNMIGKGIYLATTPDKAEEYGKNIIQAYLKPDAKIVEWHSLKHDPRYNEFFDANEKAYKIKYGQGVNDNWLDHIKEDFAKKYFDAVSYGDKEVIVMNPEAVKTKSQLTDIYNKAKGIVGTAKIGDKEIPITKGGQMEIPVQKKETGFKAPLVNPSHEEVHIPAKDVNTIKTISEHNTSGPIKEILSSKYKLVSPRTLDIFAKRLAKVKGTNIITGLMDNLARINTEIEARTRDGLREIAGQIPSVPFEETPYIPKSMGELMTKAERMAYLDTLTKKIGTKEDRNTFALAQAEYDELFKKANARAILQFEDLSIERQMLQQIMNEDSARKLLKYKDRKEGSYNLEENKTPGLDSIVEELGFKDLKDAQAELEKYLVMRDRVNSIKGELRDLRPQVEIAKLLTQFLNDVPVVKDRGVLSIIDNLANATAVRGTYKDISGFEKEALDPFRIFKKFFGPRGDEIDAAVLDGFRKSKGDMVDEIDKLASKLETTITNKFNIKRGSKEDTLVREYGEGKKGWQDLINILGEDRALEIMRADTAFRGFYDPLLDEANAILAKIYPNNPEKLIPKHANYYRHLREGSALNDTLQALKNLFDTPAGISPQLAGQSEFTKPKSKWLAFAQRRIGEKTDTTALEGALDYIAAFAYLKHISPHIGNFRYLRRRLAEVAPTPGDTGEEGFKESGINNMLVFLDNYANRLSGKSHPLDRWVSDTMPGGRRTMNIINKANNRVKGNTILFSGTSAVAQLANVVPGLASAKQYIVPGARRSFGSIFTPNLPMEQSDFLKERKMKSLVERFKLDWMDHPFLATGEAGREYAAWILRAMDTFGTNLIWNSHYEKALALNIDNPIKYADNKTRDLVGGRGVGEVPLGQESKVFQLLAPFTLEVGNAWWLMKDFVNEKDWAALLVFLIGSFVFNEASEKVRGSRVLYDPINALIEGSAMLADEDNKKAGVAKLLGRQVGEVLSNIPLGQQVAGQISDNVVESVTKFLTDVPMTKQDVFGQGDPGRFGSGWLVWEALRDPLFKFAAPFGGVQARRTLDGIDAYIDGKVESSSGKLNFNIDRSATNLVKAVLFGKNATVESNEFFDKRDELFRLLDNQQHTRDQILIDAENKWSELKDMGEERGPQFVKDELKNLAKENPKLVTKILDVIKDEKLGLDANDRLIKQLNVENGERAKYIFEEIKDLSKDEQKLKLKDWASKKVLTAQVLEQVVELKTKSK
jgi:hypothetical protein